MVYDQPKFTASARMKEGKYKDPLAERAQCEIDAKYLSELGANTIRVNGYTRDGDHDGCMEAFADAGIYVWMDLEQQMSDTEVRLHCSHCPVSGLFLTLHSPITGRTELDRLLVR